MNSAATEYEAARRELSRLAWTYDQTLIQPQAAKVEALRVAAGIKLASFPGAFLPGEGA